MNLDPELLHRGSGPPLATAEDLPGEYAQPDFADLLWANAPLDVRGSLACIRAAEKPVLVEASPLICQQSYCRIRPTFTAGLVTGCQTMWCSEEGAGRCLGPCFRHCWSPELFCLQLWMLFALLNRQGEAGNAQRFAACADADGCNSITLLRQLHLLRVKLELSVV